MSFRNNAVLWARLSKPRRTWIPRQAKSAGGKGPNATEAKYLREVLAPAWGLRSPVYQPPPIVITETSRREYTADFLVEVDGCRMYHEVKGSYRLPTHERARLAWEIAAEKHPEWCFVWAEHTKRGWEIEQWENGGRNVIVHLPSDPPGLFHAERPDWRRHKPRAKGRTK